MLATLLFDMPSENRVFQASLMDISKRSKNYVFGACIGFLLGCILLHPFSMLFQGVISPALNLRLSIFAEAFNAKHFTMAAYFGCLGLVMGCLIVFFLTALSKERERVKMLEGLLPICAYCKKIRDDSGKEKGQGEWIKMERYISQRSNANFSHGICTECYEKEVMRQKL